MLGKPSRCDAPHPWGQRLGPAGLLGGPHTWWCSILWVWVLSPRVLPRLVVSSGWKGLSAHLHTPPLSEY